MVPQHAAAPPPHPTLRIEFGGMASIVAGVRVLPNHHDHHGRPVPLLSRPTLPDAGIAGHPQTRGDRVEQS